MNDAVDGATPATAWRWGDYLLVPAQRRLLRAGVPVELEDRALDLLILLLQHPERALDKQEVITAIWGKRPVSDATLRQLVFKARRAVGDDGERQHTISTLYGRSVQWVATVETVFDPLPHPETGDGAAAIAPVMVAPEPPQQADVVSDTADVAAPARSARRGRTWLVAAACALVVVAAVVHIGDSRGWWRRTANPPAKATLVKASAPAAPAPVKAPGPPADGRVTVAVLPFLGKSPKGDTYLNDGLTEELISRLGRFPDLRVAARTSSFVFRGKSVDIREAALKLGVEYIVEGSVQRSGNRLRVRVALIGANDGFERWSSEYDPVASDVLKVEDEIAAEVLKALRPELARGGIVAHGAPSHAPVPPAAHDYYLVGLEYLNRHAPDHLEKAVAYFHKAVATSPTYADAWAALAMAYVAIDDTDIRPDTHYLDARAAVARALALDPWLARAHAVRGYLYQTQWQWPEAQAEYQRALQLDPSDAIAHEWYATYLWYMRDMTSALEQSRLAHQLDPLSPGINLNLARALAFAGRIDEAIAQYRAIIAADPSWGLAHLMLGQTLLGLKQNKQALQEMRTAIRLGPQPPTHTYIAALGVALKANGDVAGARAQYEALKKLSQKQFVSGVSLAWLSVELGDVDGAVKDLSRAVDEHDPMVQLAITDPSAWWYNDPRIAKLRARMNLPTKT